MSTDNKHDLARKADAAGWGLFFIWIGITFLASLGWGIGLVGVAAIMLGVQLARRSFDLPVHGFTLAVGLLFLVGGIWQMLGRAAPAPLVPILSIVAGALLLLSAFARRRADRTA